ncbi:uncharacterized protein F4807DRAFT_115381 [Annulohypoxylon truncatum]|uniref:uncharacterized protein n=1 Tax=Annulohypoxylon truncatum TaxID=327061 RepID=UPI002007AFCB|nr:uncharacterized protein F4807DRAFT_115381 [Annulohypoxylon truncatum]KAI1214132.1 hypothetical protein F4807DRAFT_115381 [Annulohypoxylon truncatum]
MESSPLIKAHDHARAASIATHTSDTTVAVNEHTRAAGEFANAAKNTSSVEALRTLKLLEQHHRRLSELLQIPGKVPTSQNSENDSQVSEKDEAIPDAVPATSSKSDAAGVSSEKGSQPLPTLPKQPRYPARDLGASIASNLASARGIRSKYRSQPLSPSISNTEAPGNMDAASRRSGRTKMQTMLDNSDRPSTLSSPEKERAPRQSTSQNQAENSTSTAASDEGFSRFYSAFGSIINRISAPLAFAGLPLISEEDPSSPPSTTSHTNTNTHTHTPATTPSEPQPKQPSQKRSSRIRNSSAGVAEPDLSKLYSKAALRAVTRDGQSAATDSFYVVPTSGHTASYASILTFADKEKRRLEAQGGAGGLDDITNDADDNDFADARGRGTSPAPLPHRFGGARGARTRYGDSRDVGPGSSSRGMGGGTAADKGGNNNNSSTATVIEELYTENASLKNMLDQLSRRLHAFESMSQNSGMRLAESMRLMRPGSPLSGAGGKVPPSLTSASSSAGGGVGGGAAGAADEGLAKRNRELEDQIAVMGKQMEEMERSYNKARANLVRYREKWEQLKAGAKARRAGGSASGSAGPPQGGSSEVGGIEEGLKSPSLA